MACHVHHLPPVSVQQRTIQPAGSRRAATVSVIVPFHRRPEHLQRCLEPLRALGGAVELLVVADAAVDDCHEVAAANGARVLEIGGPSGPAVARNRGAAVATGEILVFIDSDVVASGDAVHRLVQILGTQSDVAAVFGAYDESPAEQNFISQYKNLQHSYVHQSSRREAQSFWAGLGAVRASVFRDVGGFDERYSRPCIEDIDLGYRLTAAGHRILLDPRVRGCHLKRWDLLSLLKTDVRDRAIPWTQLILRSGQVQNDLNLRNAYRVSVVLSYLVLVFLALSLLSPAALGLAALAAIAAYLLNRPFYRFLSARRGRGFALRVVPLHYLFHLYNGASFATGSVIYGLGRWLGVEVPGAIPLEAWSRTALLIGDPEGSRAEPKPVPAVLAR